MQRHDKRRRSAPAHLRHTVARPEAGQRLDIVVVHWLMGALGRPFSKAVVRKIIMAGAVRLDGRPVRRAGLLLDEGSTLDARLDAEKLGAALGPPAVPGERKAAILFEDADLIAVAKPAGLVMHATADPERPDLFNTVRRLLAGRGDEPCGSGALPYLGLHHRLDVDTSGVVLFTKRERANAALAAQFERGEVTKVYHAIACAPRGRRGRAPAAWRVENRLAVAGTGRHARMEPARTGGTRAVTVFEVLEHVHAAVLVEARPETGRKHQIRAHLAGVGMPILGDARYGGPARLGRCTASRVMLHASSLALGHPVTGERLELTCPHPPDFAALLDCLRGRHDHV